LSGLAVHFNPCIITFLFYFTLHRYGQKEQ
jgi:hypothetical protein